MMYKGEHSLTFIANDEITRGFSDTWTLETEYNTWTHFHLIPTSRPVFNLPEVKTQYIDVPQRDGSIDLTTSMGWQNLPRYGMRKGTWEFWVPPFLSEWPIDYQRLANAVHGLSKRIISSDDPYFYYTGRITIDSWQNGNDGNGNTVTLGYTLEPFKTAIGLFGKRQEWDPFCFSTDYFVNKWPGEDYYTTDCDADKMMEFIFPSEWGHTEPLNYGVASDYNWRYYALDPNINKTKLFGGVVQTPFEVHITPESGSVDDSNPGSVTIRYFNTELDPESIYRHVYTYSNITSNNTKICKENDFVLSHRDLTNIMCLQIRPSFPCSIMLVAYLRSL